MIVSASARTLAPTNPPESALKGRFMLPPQWNLSGWSGGIRFRFFVECEAVKPAPPAERWVTGVPIFDTIFKGQWLLPSPLGWAGMRPLELILLILWLVKSNVISALTFPFLMLFLPIFNDGHGALSIITGRGALPEFNHLLGKENYAAAKAPPSPPWTDSVIDP